MGKVRATEWNADSTKTKYIQESDGKLTVNNSQDLNPLLKRNKELYNLNDGYTASRDMRRIASVLQSYYRFGLKNIMGLIIGGLYLKKHKKK